MRKLFYCGYPLSAFLFVCELSVTLVVGLTGCASKNPLMEDAQPVRADAQPSVMREQGLHTSNALADATATDTPMTRPTGMQRFLGIVKPYKIDVQQGNFISREMVTQLKEGMQRDHGVTREQVRFVLGTPLLTDILHADRWDYMFRLQKRTGEVISSRVTVFFNGNRLTRIESGMLPTEQEYLAFIADSVPGSTASVAK